MEPSSTEEGAAKESSRLLLEIAKANVSVPAESRAATMKDINQANESSEFMAGSFSIESFKKKAAAAPQVPVQRTFYTSQPVYHERVFMHTSTKPIEMNTNMPHNFIGSRNSFKTFLRGDKQKHRLEVFEKFKYLNRQLTQAHLRRPHAGEKSSDAMIQGIIQKKKLTNQNLSCLGHSARKVSPNGANSKKNS